MAVCEAGSSARVGERVVGSSCSCPVTARPFKRAQASFARWHAPAVELREIRPLSQAPRVSVTFQSRQVEAGEEGGAPTAMPYYGVAGAEGSDVGNGR